MDQAKVTRGDGGSCSLDYLLINLGRNEVAAKRLVRLFLEHLPIFVRRLDESVRASDLHSLQQAVHDIRGNCVLFSAHECLYRARRIETGLHNHIADNMSDATRMDWPAEVRALRQSLEEMAVDLKSYLAEVPAAGENAP